MIFVLDNKDKVVGVLDNSAPFSCPYFDDLHTENIETGEHYYNFSVPASHEVAGALTTEGSVIIKDLDSKLQQFKIKNITEVSKSDGYYKEVECEHIAISELLTDVVRPTTLKSETLEYAMNYVLDGTEYQLGDVDFIGAVDIEFAEHVTVLEAILTIAEKFEAEIQFEVEFKNGQITKKLVHVQEKRGQVTNKLFAYSKDLLEVERIEDSEGLVTALIPVGKSDSNGKQLTLVNFAWTQDGVVTQQLDDYVYSENALQKYGKNGKHLFGVFLDTEAKTQMELFHNAAKELNSRIEPKYTYKCSVATLERIADYDSEKVRVGDTVTIQDFSFEPPLLLEARVLELTRSYTAPENDAVVLGDYKPLKISVASSVEQLKAMIAQNVDAWNAKAYKVSIQSTNGTAFKNGLGVTSLVGKLYYGNELIDTEDSKYTYHWTKTNKEGLVVENLYSKEITINASNIDEIALYTLEISEGYKTLGNAEITILNVCDGSDGVNGSDGKDGVNGSDGKDGVSQYIHIRYATSSSGADMSATPTSSSTYIGVAVTSSPTAPTSASSYKWSYVKGNTGPNIVNSTTQIEANVIKSNHIDVANLSAISANLGNVTAGKISGIDIMGSNITGANISGAVMTGGEIHSNGTDWYNGYDTRAELKDGVFKVSSSKNYIEIDNRRFSLGIQDVGSMYYYRPICITAIDDVTSKIYSAEDRGKIQIGTNSDEWGNAISNSVVVEADLTANKPATFNKNTTFGSTTKYSGVATFNSNADFNSYTNFNSNTYLKGTTYVDNTINFRNATTKFSYAPTGSNGHDFVTMRTPGGTAGTPFIQDVQVPIKLTSANLAYADITWMVPFAYKPEWVVATAIEGNSYNYLPTVYNITSTGCRIYLRHVESASATVTIQVQVLAGGRL